VGRVHDSAIVLTIALAHDVPSQRFKELYDENVGLIRTFINWGTMQINAYNQQLDGIIRNAVTARRRRLNEHGDVAALLNIPLQEKSDVPPLQRIPLEIRKPPPLAVPPKHGIKPEPGIDDAAYEKILNVIRHEGRSFETTPATFAKFDEEELRDILLAF
jgi:hypothetical protein